MVTCPNCGGVSDSGMLFCMKCGHTLPQGEQAEQQPSAAPVQTGQGQACPDCGEPIVPGAMFCMGCGRKNAQPGDSGVPSGTDAAVPPTTMQQAAAPAYAQQPATPPTPMQQAAVQPQQQYQQPQPQPPQPQAQSEKKPFYKNIAVIAIAAAVVVVLATAGFLLGTGKISFGGGGAADSRTYNRNYDYIAYIKDGELKISGFKSLAAFEATADLTSGTSRAQSASMYSNTIGLVQMPKNGSRVFYPDKFASDGSFNLYTRTIAGGGKTPGNAERIDTDIRGGYRVSEDGRNIFYIKGDAKTLYTHNLKDKTKIAGDVTEFIIDKTGSKLYYTDINKSLYFKAKNAATAEKVDSDSEVVGASPDLSTIYYTKDQTLYRRKQGDMKVKITSGVSNVLRVYDSGEIYYVKESDSDKGTVYTLFYYDGAAESKLGAGLSFEMQLAVCATKPVIAYSVKPEKEKDPANRLAVKGVDSSVEVSKTFSYPRINYEGTKLYYIDDFNDSRSAGDMWRADITNSGLSQAAMIYEGVSAFRTMRKGEVSYFSEPNKDGTAAELYLDGKIIDSDVLVGSNYEIAETGSIIYYTDFNKNKNRGALKIYADGKPIMIADDVADFVTFGAKSAAYLVVEGSSSSGEVFRFDGSKDRKQIDGDVIMLIPVFSTGSGGSVSIDDIYLW